MAYFGVCYSWARSPEQLARDLDQMAAAGVLTVRRDASWGGSEPQAPDADGHHYDWRATDETAATVPGHPMSAPRPRRSATTPYLSAIAARSRSQRASSRRKDRATAGGSARG